MLHTGEHTRRRDALQWRQDVVCALARVSPPTRFTGPPLNPQHSHSVARLWSGKEENEARVTEAEAGLVLIA
jgi:hypothetical protein